VEVIAGCDVESSYAASFTKNFPQAKTVLDDLSKLKPRDFAKRLGIKPGELTLVTGGPPCQGFSKNVPKKNRIADSSNNKLVRIFLDYCEYLKPTAIIMENVAEMKNGFDATYSQEIILRLSSAGYFVRHAVLNSADYGVPQRRRRAFFVAHRKTVPILPVPTHYSRSKDEMSLFRSHVTVWEAIGDLAPLKHGAGTSPCAYFVPAFSDYQQWARNSNMLVSNHIARKLQPKQFERLNSIEPGEGIKDLPLHLRPKGGYSGAYGRLTKEMLAPTITRWLFHPGSGRYGHPVDIRTITIREAARLQGFPDHFEFMGSFTEQSGQIGNAVPPLLALKVVQSVLGLASCTGSPSILSTSSAKSSTDIFCAAAGS